MSLQETEKRIEKLFKEWRELQSLIKPEDQERLSKKIRLEWNYNSNHIEGNTLTYGETKPLLLEGKEEGIHPERDYMEMKAHDLAINKVREYAEDKSRELTETDIRGLNKIILKEPFWKEAVTADGQKTQKKIIPGQYKKQPNSVRTETGKIFRFAEPTETPSKMKELMEWFGGEMQDPTLSVCFFLAELHHRFIVIHPFDDGNGRIARLWVNYVLLRLGYPPLVIKSEDKRNYFAALQKADGGDMATLAVYLGNVLIYWLEIGIKAAKGEDIRELEDTDKETELFIRKQKSKGLRIPLTSKTFEEISKNCFSSLVDNFIKEFSKHSALFHKTLLVAETEFLWEHPTTKEIGIPTTKNEDLKKLNKGIEEYLLYDYLQKDILLSLSMITRAMTSFFFEYSIYCGQIEQPEQSFDMKAILSISWDKFSYLTGISIERRGSKKSFITKTEKRKKEYNQTWPQKEIGNLMNEGKQLFLESLKEATEKKQG